MTALTKTLKTRIASHAVPSRSLILRTAAGAGLIAATLVVTGGIGVVGRAIADAYLQVTVFVAATLLVLYAAERGSCAPISVRSWRAIVPGKCPSGLCWAPCLAAVARSSP